MEVVEPRTTLLTNQEVFELLATVKRDRDAKVAINEQKSSYFLPQSLIKHSKLKCFKFTKTNFQNKINNGSTSE
jgi:hypothetical protein